MNTLYKSLVSRITFIYFTQVWHRRDDGWDSSEQGDNASLADGHLLCLRLGIWHSADIAHLTSLWKP